MPDTATRQLVTGVDFVSISVTDLERSRTFYRDTLGLRETVVREPYNAEFDTGTVTFCLLDVAQMELGSHVANPFHLALHVDDVPAARAALAERGVEFTRDDYDSGVCHMAFFEDPDGNALMLHHRYAPKEG